MSARNATDAVMAVLDDAHVQTWIGDRQYDALCGRIERAIAEHAIAAKDAEIARLRDALDQSALEYADLAVSAKSLEEHLHALVEVSEDSTIARARAVMNGDDIGEDEDAARAGNGGGV